MANGFKFIEDTLNDQFYVEFPDGQESEWADDQDIAVFDDGQHTFAATNCDDYPGMEPGAVYMIGGSKQQTAVEEYDDDEEEDEAEAEAGEEAELEPGEEAEEAAEIEDDDVDDHATAAS